MTKKGLEGAMEKYKETMMAAIGDLAINELKATDEAMKDYINSLGDFFITEQPDMDIKIKDAIISINGVTNMNPSRDQGNDSRSSVNPAILLKKKKDFCAGKNSTYNESTGLCDDGTTPKFATGGIVTKPMKAIVGEGGEPEAIFPLSKLETFIQSQRMGGEVTLGGDANITLNIKSDNPNLTFSETDKSEIIKTITNVIVNGAGNPSGLDSGLSNQTMLTGGNL